MNTEQLTGYMGDKVKQVKALFPANAVNLGGQLYHEKIDEKLQQHVDYYHGMPKVLAKDAEFVKGRFDKDMATFERMAARNTAEGWEYAV